MKTTIALTAGIFLAPQLAYAQTPFYHCHSGKIVVRQAVPTLEEMAILVGLDKAQRPDFGHYIFRQPDNTYIWARTSTMRAICRQNPDCRHGASASPTGLAAGPAIRFNSAGEAELCEMPEPPRDIEVSVCAADGTVQTQTIRSDDYAALDALGLGDPPTSAHQIFRNNDGNDYWSVLSPGEAAVLCIPEEDDALLNDGQWIMTFRESTVSDCPPQAVAQGEQLGRSLMKDSGTTWSEPPHPDDLMPGASQGNTWQGSGGSWSVRAVEQSQGPINVTVDYSFDVIDPDHIEIAGHLQFLMAADLAAVAGFGGNCQYRAIIDARRAN